MNEVDSSLLGDVDQKRFACVQALGRRSLRFRVFAARIASDVTANHAGQKHQNQELRNRRVGSFRLLAAFLAVHVCVRALTKKTQEASSAKGFVTIIGVVVHS